MILVTAARAAAFIGGVTLMGGCTRNVLQTVRTVKLSSSSPIPMPEDTLSSTEATIGYLQSLSREDLLRVFLCCSPPSDTAKLSGEWDGILLNNNNLGMTTIGSKFMSNILFGKGRRWNGKSFEACGSGINRFSTGEKDDVDKAHEFDLEIQESRIKGGTSSIYLDYSNYQSPLSPWRTMTDEVRCLPSGDVLLGFGAMAWSGGMLNAAPFCLYPSSEK